MESLVEECGGHYADEQGVTTDFFSLIKARGFNAIRVRLFVDYASPTGIQGAGKLDNPRVLSLAKKAKAAGLAVILDLHYSDTWADPKTQTVPYAWKDLSFDGAVTAMKQYTTDVLTYFAENTVSLDYIQIGNEINNGILWPFGAMDWSNDTTKAESFTRFSSLLKAGVSAVRSLSPTTKIILHSANALENTDGHAYQGLYFFGKMAEYGVDYDIMGSSFYKDITDTPVSSLSSSINQLTKAYSKPFFLMEYAYGYTAKSDPNAANTFTTASALKAGYPLSIQGQTTYVAEILAQLAKADNALGASYWGGDWLPVKGCGWADEDSKDSWANQALFTYEGMALPTLSVFQKATR